MRQARAAVNVTMVRESFPLSSFRILSYLASLKARYAKASKKGRSQILDKYMAAAGCHRKHVIAVLSGRRQRVKGPIRRPRRAIYTDEDARAILALADGFDHLCSKRLGVAMDNKLPKLKLRGFLDVSPSTMDRLGRRYGRRRGRPRGFTKPGTLPESQIPIRT